MHSILHRNVKGLLPGFEPRRISASFRRFCWISQEHPAECRLSDERRRQGSAQGAGERPAERLALR